MKNSLETNFRSIKVFNLPTVSIYIRHLSSLASPLIIYFISFDNVKPSLYLFQILLKKIKQRGKYIFIAFDLAIITEITQTILLET